MLIKEEFVDHYSMFLDGESDDVINECYKHYKDSDYGVCGDVVCFLDYVSLMHTTDLSEVERIIKRDGDWNDDDCRWECIKAEYGLQDSVRQFIDEKRAFASLYDWAIGAEYIFEVKE